jgi:hypothetical protein
VVFRGELFRSLFLPHVMVALICSGMCFAQTTYL